MTAKNVMLTVFMNMYPRRMLMFKYTLQRIFYLTVVFLIITFMCFVLIRMLPPLPLDPMRPETLVVEQRRELMGYNKPYIVQFGIFIKNIFTDFNWGVSEKRAMVVKLPMSSLRSCPPRCWLTSTPSLAVSLWVSAWVSSQL